MPGFSDGPMSEDYYPSPRFKQTKPAQTNTMQVRITPDIEFRQWCVEQAAKTCSDKISIAEQAKAIYEFVLFAGGKA
jgi:hypothetical protein